MNEQQQKAVALIEQLREMKSEIAPQMAMIKKVEAELKSTVMELGETVSHDGSTVSIRSGYERVSWDGKKLAGYAAAHPEIEAFKKVSVVKPSVSIKL